MMLVALALGASLASGQPRVAPLSAMVEISLVPADDQPFYQRAPVALGVDVRNRTEEGLTVALVLALVDYRYARARYRKLPEPFRELTFGPEWTIDSPVDPAVDVFALEPSGTKRFNLSLATDPGRATFLFGEPGDYEVMIESDIAWRSPKEVLATPPLRIRVEPVPPSEAAALADWDVDLATFAQDDGGRGGPHYQREATRALKFMDKHPNSLYSRLLRKRTADSLERLRREGVRLTDYEQDAFERLKQTLREEAQRDATSR